MTLFKLITANYKDNKKNLSVFSQNPFKQLKDHIMTCYNILNASIIEHFSMKSAFETIIFDHSVQRIFFFFFHATRKA